jgi:hypothetical protein
VSLTTPALTSWYRRRCGGTIDPLDEIRRLLVVVLASCGSSASAPADAYRVLDAPAHPGAGPGGGLLDQLVFAVVGDTRPANLDDTANYPTAIVGAIWADVEASTPYPAFAITTGDYMFASITGDQIDPQLDAYFGARAAYRGVVYPAMGNHECNGYTSSNCGPSGKDGEPANYLRFVDRLLGPIGESRPYYAERFAASDGSWSAKVVEIAANAWDATQEAWLDRVLAEPSTYTFAVRHEPHYSDTAPGVDPSQTVLARHPLTMLVTGHTHAYTHVEAYREIIGGNGGAPLTSTTNYGYVIVARQPDGTLQVTSFDYASRALVDQFTVTANGVAP